MDSFFPLQNLCVQCAVLILYNASIFVVSLLVLLYIVVRVYITGMYGEGVYRPHTPLHCGIMA